MSPCHCGLSITSLCVLDCPQESSASVAERHLGPETLLIGHSFQQEFLSELETGAELLQANAQQLVGHALSQSLWQQMDQAPPARPQPDHGRKVMERLASFINNL